MFRSLIVVIFAVLSVVDARNLYQSKSFDFLNINHEIKEKYGVPKRENNNTPKIFFPILEIETTIPHQRQEVHYQEYESTRPAELQKNYGLPYNEPPELRTQSGVPHMENNSSEILFLIFEIKTNTPSEKLVEYKQKYAMASARPPKKHEESRISNEKSQKPDKHYSVPTEENNAPKTFFPIFEIDTTTPSQELVVPHQIYGIPSTRPPKPDKDAQPDEEPQKPYKQYGVPHSENNHTKTFYPLSEIDISNPSEESHKLYTQYDVLHRDQNTQKRLFPIYEIETISSSPKPAVPQQVYGVPNTRPPKPHKEYGLPTEEQKII